MAHTMSFAVEDYVLNDVPVGELGLWMVMAGYFGVPVVMVSGDQAACDEAKALAPGIEAAAVKTGINRGSARGLTKEENSVFNSVAIHLHPDQARTMIRAHAYRAVKRIPEIAPYRMEPPFKLVISTRREEGKKAGEEHVRKANDFLDLVLERKRTASPARPKARRKPAPKPGGKKTRKRR